MQYWVHINGQQQGPMQIDELARMGITSDTYVWREGLEDWVKASELEELSRLFVAPAVPDSNGEIAASGSENCSQQAIDTQDANPVEGSGAVAEEESGQPSSCQASSSVVPPEVPVMEPQPMPYSRSAICHLAPRPTWRGLLSLRYFAASCSVLSQ